MLIAFFKWCTIINGSILLFWSLVTISMPDLLYRTQSKWFQMPRESYNVVTYKFIGVFKIFFIFFNFVPFIALLILK